MEYNQALFYAQVHILNQSHTMHLLAPTGMSHLKMNEHCFMV